MWPTRTSSMKTSRGGLQRCRKRLKLVHLSDTRKDTYRHDPIGQGNVPFEAVKLALDAAATTRGQCWKLFRTTPIATSPKVRIVLQESTSDMRRCRDNSNLKDR